jgi:hypothetical protein
MRADVARALACSITRAGEVTPAQWAPAQRLGTGRESAADKLKRRAQGAPFGAI